MEKAKIISKPKVIVEKFRTPTQDYCGHCEYWSYLGLDFSCNAVGICNAQKAGLSLVEFKNRIVYATERDCESDAFTALTNSKRR